MSDDYEEDDKVSDDFRDGLTEDEKTSFDNMILRGCSRESFEKFITDIYVDFDSAWDALKKENPGAFPGSDDLEEEEETTEEKNLNKEYASMESLPDRQGDEPVREDKVEGIDLDEIYPEMRKLELTISVYHKLSLPGP